MVRYWPEVKSGDLVRAVIDILTFRILARLPGLLEVDPSSRVYKKDKLIIFSPIGRPTPFLQIWNALLLKE
jgi:hypothetical protein